MSDIKLLTLDPGHFHAALVQKEMYPEVSPLVHVYAPLGPDLIAHLNRIVGFNTRSANPTSWRLEVHAAPDFLDRLLRDRSGNVVVLSGRNHVKIDYLQAAVEAGLHVLADKPWIINAEDLTKLELILNTTEAKGLIAYDIMTERYEITSILQREFVNDAETFGTPVAGTAEEPGVFMESVHYLMKSVAGVPLRRPAWFFDTTQQGEGLTDVGTHLVDLVPWILFPRQPLDYRRDVSVVAARRWPTVLTRSDFQRVTGEADFPKDLSGSLENDRLNYYCNTFLSCTVRGIHTSFNVLWDFEAAAGAGDTHLAVFRGTRARVEVRQGKEQNYRPELYIIPNATAEVRAVGAAVIAKVAALQKAFPGIAVQEQQDRLWITVPQEYRVGHEAHFAQVTRQFLEYLRNPQTLPGWEKPNLLAKYFLTTQGVHAAQLVRC
jgi:predicted dehydrogenase